MGWIPTTPASLLRQRDPTGADQPPVTVSDGARTEPRPCGFRISFWLRHYGRLSEDHVSKHRWPIFGSLSKRGSLAGFEVHLLGGPGGLTGTLAELRWAGWWCEAMSGVGFVNSERLRMGSSLPFLREASRSLTNMMHADSCS